MRDRNRIGIEEVKEGHKWENISSVNEYREDGKSD